MVKIGITYVKGAVPGFEDFGNLPTDIVKSNGLVNGVKASEELDSLIIPGGTLIESGDISDDLKKEIIKMANAGKPIIGICAGFQLLGNQIDIGRKSAVPIVKKGIGLIDVDFSPLITSDRVKAEVHKNSFIVDGINEDIDGYHTHTYGKVIGDAKPLFYSKIQRMNYGDNEKKIFSGAVNDDGNVIGTMIHNLLDENPKIVSNLLDYLDIKENEIADIYKRNSDVKKFFNSEIGINAGYKVEKTKGSFLSLKGNEPKFLMIGSTGSDSGKTFLVTGLAGALRRRGLKVGLLKVGPDVRDLIPGLYLTKGKMEEFNSIKIGHLGWMEFSEIINKLKSTDYDIVLIEGVMSVFTGTLNEISPYSASEIAASSNIPMLLVTGVNKGGIESGAVDIVSHAKMLEKLGVDVEGIILNKVYNEDIFNSASEYIAKETNVDYIDSVEKLKLEMRGTTPEIEIKYDLFSKTALETVEKNLNIEKIAGMASEIEFNKYLTFEEIKKLWNQ